MLKYSTEDSVLYSADYWKLGRLDEKEMPDEETLFNEYQQVISRISPRPLIIHIKHHFRDYDISNQHLHTQLRAVLRASAHGDLRILFSMISCVEEMVTAKIALAKAQQDLSLEGVAYCDEMPLGIAIETSAAAVHTGVLAQECDFFIINTQDLVRHALASNFTDQQIKEYEAIYNPAILILMKYAIDGAHTGGLTCGIWGEAAEDFGLLPALIGLGADDLFTRIDRINRAREIICRISGKSCEKLTHSLLKASTRSEVIEQLESMENPLFALNSGLS